MQGIYQLCSGCRKHPGAHRKPHQKAKWTSVRRAHWQPVYLPFLATFTSFCPRLCPISPGCYNIILPSSSIQAGDREEMQLCIKCPLLIDTLPCFPKLHTQLLLSQKHMINHPYIVLLALPFPCKITGVILKCNGHFSFNHFQTLLCLSNIQDSPTLVQFCTSTSTSLSGALDEPKSCGACSS